MARGRFISTTIALDPDLNQATPEAQLLFMRCIPHLDRDGLIIGQPAALWARVAPLMESLLPQIPRLLDELVARNLIVRYSTRIGPVLWFKGFTKNQPGMRYDREGPSEFECPPGMKRTPAGLVADAAAPAPDLPQPNSGVTPELLRSYSGQTPPEVKDQDQDDGDDPRARADAAAATPADGLPSAPPSPAPDPLPHTDGVITAAVTARLEQVGVCLTAYTIEQYTDLVTECGLPAVLAGIKAAADNGRQHRFNYVAQCARNKAQGIAPAQPERISNGSTPLPGGTDRRRTLTLATAGQRVAPYDPALEAEYN